MEEVPHPFLFFSLQEGAMRLKEADIPVDMPECRLST
jgi:hypothetical protein